MSLVFTGCIPDYNSIYDGTLPGTIGGVVTAGDMEITIPPGTNSEDIKLTVKQVNTLPHIQGTAEQLEAYSKLKVVSPAYDVTVENFKFDQPAIVQFKVDPALFTNLKEGEGIFLCSVSDDGVFDVPRLINIDSRNGSITVEVNHFSTLFTVSATIGILLLFAAATVLTYQTYYGRGDALTRPWQYIEPGNEKIRKFIEDNNIRLPDTRSATEFDMQGYNKKFGVRNTGPLDPPYTGSQTLEAKDVVCWDLTNLFGSILYTMASDKNKGIDGEKMRLIKGYAGATLHSWIEIIIDGRVYVVDTTNPGAFKFIDKDTAYENLKLKPSQTYTKDADSLVKYNEQSPWYLQFSLGRTQIEAQIKELTQKHRRLQEELEKLNQSAEITDEIASQMDIIRGMQKELYSQVMALKKKLQEMPAPN